ncbi:MAG: helix-turn-helix transcriptional regulator [Pseudomonadota bacterium]
MKFPHMPQLSKRLKYIRSFNNLSQADLADKAGTTQQAIQQAEKGKARQPRYLHQLSKSLDIPIDWLLTGEEQSHEPAPVIKEGLFDQSSEVLDSFFSMPKEDQKLIYELMQTRRKK